MTRILQIYRGFSTAHNLGAFFLALLPLSGACGSSPHPVLHSQPSSENAEAGDELHFIDPKPIVSLIDLDEDLFRVTGFRVGLQDYMASETPAVVYQMPEQADYVEILRCTADTKFDGTGEDLIGIDASGAASESYIYQANDFWSLAKKIKTCVAVASDHLERESFLDSSAGSGSYRYLIRSCIDSARVEEKNERHCSRQVSASPILENFVNKRQKKELLANEALEQEKSKIDALGRAIYFNTIELNNAIVACEANESKRVATVQQKRAIAAVLGTGISFASSITSASAAGGSATDVFQSVWGGRDKALGSGGPMADTLADLFTDPGDFPRSCTGATKAMNDGIILTSALKAAHQIFATTKDAATQVSKSRSSGGTVP